MDQKGKAKKKLQVLMDKSLPAVKRNKALGSFIGMFDVLVVLCCVMVLCFLCIYGENIVYNSCLLLIHTSVMHTPLRFTC